MTIANALIFRLDTDRCELGEGPHYDRSEDTAWWLDIVGRKLIEYRFTTGEALSHALPKMASVVASIDANRQLLVMEDGLYVRKLKTGMLDLISPLEADNPVTRSNDGRVHSSGRLWIGTMGKNAEKQAGAIYWFDGKDVRLLYPKLSIPNSICFSPDGSIGYFADTAVNTVWRVPVDPETGLPTAEPEIFLTGDDLPLGGYFDGSVTDADGILWNATWRGGSVTGFGPDGTPVQTFEVPAAQVSCPCFIGKNLDAMLVTTAWQNYSDAQRMADPGAGLTFVINGNFNGQADTPFRLQASGE